VAAGLLRDLTRQTGLNLSELSEAADVPESTLRDYTTGRCHPSLGTLIRIVEAAGLELRLHLDTRDRHDELLHLRADPAMIESLAGEERARIAQLKAEATAHRSAPDASAESSD
jgi:transcriptional regulator with XRE-family HTH domain